MARLGIGSEVFQDLPTYKKPGSYPIPPCGVGIDFEFYGREASKTSEGTYNHKKSGTQHAFITIPLTFVREDTEGDDVQYWDQGIFIDVDDKNGLALLKKIVESVGMGDALNEDFDPEQLRGIRIKCDVDHSKDGEKAYPNFDTIIVMDDESGEEEEEEEPEEKEEEVEEKVPPKAKGKAKPGRPPRTGRGNR